MLFHICSKIMIFFLTVQSFRTDKINISLENNSQKNGGVIFMLSAYFPMKLYICSKFHENIDDCFIGTGWTWF